jgi:hypothetical protein
MVKINLLVPAPRSLPSRPDANYGGMGVACLNAGKDLWILWI